MSELLWFDRDHDASGNPIRNDVREAARKKWPQLRAMAIRRIGDRELEIQEVFERVVAKVSAYLNEIQSPPQDPSGLLVLRFKQDIGSLARRIERLQLSGDTSDMESLLENPDWGKDVDRQIFLEEIVRSLSDSNRAALRLRGAGYSWDEIAAMFGAKSSTLRNQFWREIERLHQRFTGTASQADAEADEQQGKVS